MKLEPRERAVRPNYLMDNAAALRLGELFLGWRRGKQWRPNKSKATSKKKPAAPKEQAAHKSAGRPPKLTAPAPTRPPPSAATTQAHSHMKRGSPKVSLGKSVLHPGAITASAPPTARPNPGGRVRMIMVTVQLLDARMFPMTIPNSTSISSLASMASTISQPLEPPVPYDYSPCFFHRGACLRDGQATVEDYNLSGQTVLFVPCRSPAAARR